MSFGYPTNLHNSVLDSSLSISCFFTCAGQPHTLKYEKSSFLPLYISYGVEVTNFLGKTLRTHAAVSSAYPQSNIGNFEKLIMDRAMSNKVRFHLSDT